MASHSVQSGEEQPIGEDRLSGAFQNEVVTENWPTKSPMKTGQKQASYGGQATTLPDTPDEDDLVDNFPVPITCMSFLGGEHVRVTVTPTSAYVQDVVAQAMAERFRITACSCGGPRIHSKVKGESKCFRCGLVEIADAPLAYATHQKCRRCQKFRWAVAKSVYCDYCYEKVQAA